MSVVRAVFFDLGLTLIYSPREASFIKVAEELGVKVNLQDVKEAHLFVDHFFMRNYPGVLAQDPEDFYDRYISMVLSYLHLDLALSTFLDNLFKRYPPRKVWVPYPDSTSTLRRLKEMGVAIGLISNWDGSARQVLKNVGLYDFFDDVLISSEVGISKPDPRIFEMAIERLGVSAEESLYVGDNYFDDVVGANSIGMKAMLIRRSPVKYWVGEGNYEIIHSLSEVLNKISNFECAGA